MKSLKQWFNNFIKDMGKASEESFGDKKLGCCGLNTNKPKNPTKPQK
ncbi:LDCC motif putative metal-binding protein [Clostridium sp. CF012]|nr:LDCC motif putative metal-binding protein [Clostridium sp. CF012]MBU3143699.1 hypothetical protein [Clostridium sp. CF012]